MMRRWLEKKMAKGHKYRKSFKSIDNIINAPLENLISVDEIGERIAQSVVDYFQVEQNRVNIEKFKAHGLQFQIQEKEGSSDKFVGKAFVVSGVFSAFSRDELKELIESNGGKNVSSISKKTDYVVAGENMGPAKLQKATELGVAIISENEFIQLISQ